MSITKDGPAPQFKQQMIYDPPDGWRYGFPKPYNPCPGESMRDTLESDGYPSDKIDDTVVKYCRFWEAPVPIKPEAVVVQAPKLTDTDLRLMATGALSIGGSQQELSLEVIRLREENERLRERLQIDPGGGDWIDVLEKQIEDLTKQRDAAVVVVKASLGAAQMLNGCSLIFLTEIGLQDEANKCKLASQILEKAANDVLIQLVTK